MTSKPTEESPFGQPGATASRTQRAPTAPIVLEPVACDLCGADDTEPILSLRDLIHRTTGLPFTLVRCRRCGLRYLNPRPILAQLDRFYPVDYAPHRRGRLAAAARRWLLRRELRALWPLLAPPRRVLELGCGSGDLLQIVRELGNPNVMGIEPSASAADLARQRWGLEVVRGTLEEARLTSGSFDVALAQHVLEHLPSPSATLAELARVLRPGGTLVLWLPNAGSWAARVWGPAWMGYDAPRHLYTFDLETLRVLLDRHGFGVAAVRHEWVGIEWSWGLRLALRQRGHDGDALERLLGRLHLPLTVAATPVSLAAALARRSGRVRVVARLRA
ncbi:class I SAM-dependent methyltransferase [Thermomicrobiaceae bacterium CFH 74404]|uniref:Class I SAM-dependent methyltransferase n=1 Tax=Thermalbibacter longus TaxID=2951981 RepID=A0AA42BDU7_9BACT|nr:class I SAM-dependent methyltransferase [Thermalbibacter longus]MCM8750108.1 class I SAM-dependent methyltransferase [Thermalbibacter longus]